MKKLKKDRFARRGMVATTLVVVRWRFEKRKLKSADGRGGK